jgi:hypothetical protein
MKIRSSSWSLASPSEALPRNRTRTVIPTVQVAKTPPKRKGNQPVKHSNTPAPTPAPTIIARPAALVGVAVDARTRVLHHTRVSANFEGTEIGDESNGTQVS